MRVCKVQLSNYNGPVVYEMTESKHVQDVLQEVDSLLQEALNGDDPEITISVEEMSKAEFDRLGEFTGY